MGQIIDIQEESKAKFKDCTEWYASIDEEMSNWTIKDENSVY